MSSVEPAGAASPDTADADDPVRAGLLDALRAEFGDAIVDVRLDPGHDLWVRVRTEAWQPLARTLSTLGFEYFCFLSVIDWLPSPFGRYLDSDVDRRLEGEAPRQEPDPIVAGYCGGDTRFQVFARVYSISRKLGVNVKADVPDDSGAVDTWSGVYGGANWHEREAHEMYGVEFTGHPALRNLYLPGGFEGHPLRKDYPLLSRMVKPWPGIVDVEGMPGGDDEEGGE